MKFKHIAAVLAGAAALSAPSCDLNEKFYSEVTPDTFFTSPESTYAVLCRPFTHWKWYIGADRWYLQELTTDEMTCPKRGADWYNGGEYYRLHYHTWSPDDRFVVNTYDGTTGGISRALEAKADLEGVDYNAIGLSDAVKADHINQLNAITAYFYMKGLDYFGGMPIYHSVNDGLRPRNTALETYRHVETLLKNAIPALAKKSSLGAPEDGYIKQAAAARNTSTNARRSAATSSAAFTASTNWTTRGTAPTRSTTTLRTRRSGTFRRRTRRSSGAGISSISTTIRPMSISTSKPPVTTASS